MHSYIQKYILYMCHYGQIYLACIVSNCVHSFIHSDVCGFIFHDNCIYKCLTLFIYVHQKHHCSALGSLNNISKLYHIPSPVGNGQGIQVWQAGRQLLLLADTCYCLPVRLSLSLAGPSNNIWNSTLYSVHYFFSQCIIVIGILSQQREFALQFVCQIFHNGFAFITI